MLRKAVLTVVCLLFIMGVALAVTGGPLSLAAEKVRFGTPHKLEPHHNLALLAADEKGFFKEEGVELDWIPFKGGRRMQRAVIAGRVDMASTLTIFFINGVSKGLPGLLVADLQMFNPFFISVPTNSPIKEARELTGVKIGISRIGSLSQLYVQAIAKKLGLEGQFKFIGVGGYLSMVAALKTGSIGAMATDFFVTMPLKLRGEVRSVVELTDYLPDDWAGLALYAHRDFAKNNGQAVRNFVKSYFRGTEFIMKNRRWTIDKMKSFVGYSEAVAQATYPVLRWGKGDKINIKGIKNVIRFMLDSGFITKDKVPSMDKLVTTKFIQ